MILITETGYENLSGVVPIEVTDIEPLMAGTALSGLVPVTLRPRRVERVVREDEQRAPVRRRRRASCSGRSGTSMRPTCLPSGA